MIGLAELKNYACRPIWSSHVQSDRGHRANGRTLHSGLWQTVRRADMGSRHNIKTPTTIGRSSATRCESSSRLGKWLRMAIGEAGMHRPVSACSLRCFPRCTRWKEASVVFRPVSMPSKVNTSVFAKSTAGQSFVTTALQKLISSIVAVNFLVECLNRSLIAG